MLTTEEQRDEAARLLSLNEDGLVVESVALALRIGEQSSNAAKVLHDLDVLTVENMFNAGTRVRDGQTDVGDSE